ncbi:MAG: enoyl-CoA hydratase/isomerase family protein [Rhodocyclaceae bacterium]|nr:enoyl-CoA hydratase/isomerase family protein [Rhodocyclaceae bacterium]
MNYETLAIEKQGAVDWLTLNRPAALNALNRRMMDELLDYFGGLLNDDSVRIVALRGAGRAFCAGWDVKDSGMSPESLVAGGPQAAFAGARHASEIVRRMRRCPQPIVAMVNGAACGGGFALVAATDIRIATPSARMNAAFVRIGLSGCDMGLSYHLPRLVGAAVTSELLLTGRFIDARRALAVGLVSEVVEEAQLERAARVYIDEMLAATPLGLRLTKEGLNINLGATSLEAATALEDRNQALCMQAPEFRGGLGARKP